MRLVVRDAVYEFPRRPLVMGIVNLCADSFSGDGTEDISAALATAEQQLAAGAEIIDIGAESARTNRVAISEAEETTRLLAFIERWSELRASRPSGTAPPQLSINTWRPAVVRQVLPRGGDLLNDLSGLPTDENARVCAGSGAALLMMHTVGEPKVRHTDIRYNDVMAEMERFFTEKLALAEGAGMDREGLLIDPGIDFAKQRADNLHIFQELERLLRFERPILLPVSRKSFIGEVLGIPEPAARDAGTVACIVQGMLKGTSIFRVHNVRAAVQTIDMISAVEGAAAS